jgi:hypothetical protein
MLRSERLAFALLTVLSALLRAKHGTKDSVWLPLAEDSESTYGLILECEGPRLGRRPSLYRLKRALMFKPR